MRRRASILTFLLVLLTPVVVLTSTQPAWAVTCSGSPVDQNIKAAGYQWDAFNPSGQRDVDGVRAPIENRTDGALCDSSQFGGNSDDVTWIAIVGTNGSPTAIVQIGFRRYWDNGTRRECMWWEQGTTQAVFNCNNLSNDTDYYFKIHLFNGKYLISSCGTSGSYDPSNCTVQNGDHDVFNNPAGQIAVEAHWSCGLHIFGNSTDQQNVGIPTSPIQGLNDSGNWTTRTWGSLGSDCSQYIQSELNQGETMKFYDTRNTQ